MIALEGTIAPSGLASAGGGQVRAALLSELVTSDATGGTSENPIRVTVVGIAADGWAGLGETTRRLIKAAPLVIAGHRLQTQLPDIPGQDRRRWPTPMLPTLQALLDAYAGQEILLLTSADRLAAGLGATLIDQLGAANVLIVPAARDPD